MELGRAWKGKVADWGRPSRPLHSFDSGGFVVREAGTGWAVSPSDGGSMSPYVLVRLASGEEVLLRPGDRIGRHARCELQIADQRVSEIHASVTVRGRSLRLLQLRGGISVNGRLVGDVPLEPGQVLELAPGIPLEIREVHLPQRVLAVEAEGLVKTVLAGTTSLYLRHPREVATGYRADADAWLFDDGSDWFCRFRGEIEGPLAPGELALGEWRLRLILDEIPSSPATMGGFQRPDDHLRIESWFDQVRIFCGLNLAVQLTGKKARILAELVEVGAPVDWEAVARSVWPEVVRRSALRKRWDTTLGRLRRALSDGGVRPDLIDADGKGCVALVLYPGDEVEERD